MSKSVKIRFLGVFKRAYGSRQTSLQAKKKEKIRDVIQEIMAHSPELRHSLIDPELNSPLPNAVILVNGKEISILDGLETKVGNGDEIVLIPVVHSG